MTNLKNKIKRLSKGDFHIPQPEIIFPETRIIMRVGEGEMYKGSFSLQNQGEGTIRGWYIPLLIVSIVRNRASMGTRLISIIHMMVPGWCRDMWNMAGFTIVCNGGEYDVAFTAIIEKPLL